MLVCPKEQKQLPLEGRLLDGKFRFVKLLGAGGMGAVWKAHNTRVKKAVAIKLMHPEFAGNPGILDRFRQEATAAGEIGSQHICDIYDFGPSVLGPYIVLEMLNGRSLGELITQYGRVDPGLCAIVIRQALEGLEAAHRVGIVHRDLKPENIFLHEPTPGRLLVKLMDFGISKFSMGDGAGKTSAGVLMGTPEYMSPEQSEGAASVDARTDIWAMGAILYKALTGIEAFAGPTMASTLVAVATKEPRPITEFSPNCPPELIAIVAKCLAKHPGGRYSSARELSDALAPFEQMSGSLPPPPNAPTSAGGFATAASSTATSATATSGPQPTASGGTLVTRGNPNAPPPATLITGGPGGPPMPTNQASPSFVGNPGLAAPVQDDSWSIGATPNTRAPSTLSGSPTSPGTSSGGNGKIVVITIVLLLIAAGVAVAVVMRTPKSNDTKKNQDPVVANNGDTKTPDTRTTAADTAATPPDTTVANPTGTPPDPTAGATAGATPDPTAGATAGPPDPTGGTPDPTGDTPDPTGGDTKETKETKEGKGDKPKPKPEMSLVIKTGTLFAPKQPAPSNYRNQAAARAYCSSLRAKKFANLTGWSLANEGEILRFKDFSEVNKRTYWADDKIVAGRVKLVQMIGGRTVEHDVNEPRLQASALCVAKN